MFNSLRFRFDVVKTWRDDTVLDFHLWTALSLLPKVKHQLWFLPVYIQPLSFLLLLFLFFSFFLVSLFGVYLFFLPGQEEY